MWLSSPGHTTIEFPERDLNSDCARTGRKGDTTTSDLLHLQPRSINGHERNMMSISENTLPVIYLKTGEIHFSEQSASVFTVLGSCLAVTMFHRRSGIGSICHGLLPECLEKERCRDCPEPGKYVVCAIQWMMRRFEQQGVSLHEIEIKVFGGADTFSAEPGGRRGIASIGQRNTETAMQTLKKEGLSILSSDVGGATGRKLFFNTHTGEVLLKRLQPRVILAGTPGKK
jgi:chemotaxis protein CheD